MHCKPEMIAVNNRRYYKKHREKILGATLSRHRKFREFFNWLKSGPCTDCGRSFSPYVMDFDHIGPKTITPAKLSGASIERIQDELKNCQLVCANCHRERTHRSRIGAPRCHQ